MGLKDRLRTRAAHHRFRVRGAAAIMERWLPLLLALAAPAFGNSDPQQDEIERLKTQVRTQQEEIDELRRRLDAQQKLLEGTLLPNAPAQPPSAVTPSPAPSAAPAAPPDSAPVSAPLSLQLGGVTFTPTGFINLAQVWRSKTVTSGLPTNFAAIPFNDTVLGHRRQTLSSAQNTRLGLRMNTRVLGFDVLGLVEGDFNGYVPNNVATTSNSYGFRLRLAFIDLRKNRWELLAGQNWSLLTPARKGISPFPDTLFLTQDLDPNVQSGLVWARSPQLRFVFHASRSVAMGLSFESGDTYAGGSAGAGVITLPAALAPNYFGQVDTSTQNGNSVPNPNLDWIGKIAFDPKAGSRPIHIELAGVLNRYFFYNPLNNRNFSISGAGGAFNVLFEPAPHLTLVTANYYNNGGGDYIFGEAPDLVIQATGAPSLLPSGSTVNGFEYEPVPKWKFWGYYGGTWIGRISTFDPGALQPVGYGYVGSPDSQNRTIQEVTAGFHRIFWSNPNYGSFQFAGQYSWLVRHPWYVAPGRPNSANLNMVYLGFRYTLPGSLPEPK
ncbi:MAG TPA: hypothetical protein VH639_08015 [Bryobacteraceae bacterium]|jgi:type II secretory pathway pseudopilin PulG